MEKSKKSNKLHQSNKTRLEELKRTEKERQADCILKIKNHVETSINICKNDLSKTRLYEAEKTISKLGYEFGRLLIELYLISHSPECRLYEEVVRKQVLSKNKVEI